METKFQIGDLVYWISYLIEDNTHKSYVDEGVIKAIKIVLRKDILTGLIISDISYEIDNCGRHHNVEVFEDYLYSTQAEVEEKLKLRNNMWFEKLIKKEKENEVVDKVDYKIERELKNGYKVVSKYLMWVGYNYNVLDLNNNLISEKWFYSISIDEEFDEDNYIKVLVDSWGGKLFYNYLNINGTLRFEKGYNALYKCDNGLILSAEYLRCSYDMEYCYHKKDNTILGNRYFEMVGHSFNEVVDVKVKDQGYNLFTENGEIVSKVYFDELYYFGDVYVVRLKNNKYTFIDKKANFLTNERFDKIDIEITNKRFKDSDNKLAIIQKNELFNLFSIEKGFLSDVWFEEYGDAQDDLIKVKIKGDWYFINKNTDLFDIETLEKI